MIKTAVEFYKVFDLRAKLENFDWEGQDGINVVTAFQQLDSFGILERI